MGTEVSSENWGWVASPRISFSQDISCSDGSPGGPTNVWLDPDAAEFDFSISSSSVVSLADPSPADELFSDGKILPLPIKMLSSISNCDTPPSVLRLPPTPNPNPPPISHDIKRSLREVNDKSVGGRHRPFWRFNRSTSTGSCKSRGGLISPFPLARSKSASSFQNQNPNPNPTTEKPCLKTNHRNIDDNQRNSEVKTCYNKHRRSITSSGNVMRINPVLNVPAPNFPRGSSRTTGSNNNTSVLAYLLCNCKDKNLERSALSSSP